MCSKKVISRIIKNKVQLKFVVIDFYHSETNLIPQQIKISHLLKIPYLTDQ